MPMNRWLKKEIAAAEKAFGDLELEIALREEARLGLPRRQPGGVVLKPCTDNLYHFFSGYKQGKWARLNNPLGAEKVKSLGRPAK